MQTLNQNEARHSWTESLPISEAYRAVVTLGLEIGDIQREAFHTRDFKMKTKSSEVDLVTEVDVLCDEKIVGKLQELFPEDAILTEEQGDFQGQSGFQWIIDPLDGTTNFAIGHPIFAVSIARWEGEQPIFGLVFVPMLDMLFIAERGKGAFGNGKRLVASTQDKLVRSVIGTGFPYDRATTSNHNGDNVAKMVPLVKGIRRLGAAAYDLCLVASGVYDAFWEMRLSKWDLAAGRLMIEEAGGYFWSEMVSGKYNCITGSETLCGEIKAIVDLSAEER